MGALHMARVMKSDGENKQQNRKSVSILAIGYSPSLRGMAKNLIMAWISPNVESVNSITPKGQTN
jgi:hypothetical protein